MRWCSPGSCSLVLLTVRGSLQCITLEVRMKLRGSARVRVSVSGWNGSSEVVNLHPALFSTGVQNLPRSCRSRRSCVEPPELQWLHPEETRVLVQQHRRTTSTKMFTRIPVEHSTSVKRVSYRPHRLAHIHPQIRSLQPGLFHLKTALLLRTC